MSKPDKRNYNVFFNLHTVSGITISVALFVIFFAGAFALFLENINNWESNSQHHAHTYAAIDYDRLLDSLNALDYELYDRTFFINQNEEGKSVQLNAQPLAFEQDSLKADSSLAALYGPIALNYDLANWQSVEAAEHHHDGLGDFLYHLHYFEPIPVVGIYLSGLVGVFFLLAIVTGIIVHWKKIRSNFFTFRLKATIKNLWTDAHTALGVIGLPFQLMYAVTGALFGLTILIFMPSVMLLFDGDQEAMIGYVYPAYTTYELEGPLNQTTADASQEYLSVNKLVNEYLAEFKDEEIRYVNVSLQNYQDRNAHLLVMLDTEPKKRFYSQAYKIFRLRDGLVVREKGLDQNPHNESVVNFVHFIHFGSFGGYFIKGFYFIMALITCFVIISGVLVWLKARDMKKYAAKAKFNTNVGALYLGISLGLFPSIAFIFCLAKILPLEMADRMTTMETIFFLFWLGYSVYSFIQKDYFKISRNAFALAGIIGLAVPVLNGIQTGMWFWQAIPMAYLDVAMIDISWLVIGGVSIATAYYMKPVIDKKKLKKQEAQVLEPA